MNRNVEATELRSISIISYYILRSSMPTLSAEGGSAAGFHEAEDGL